MKIDPEHICYKKVLDFKPHKMQKLFFESEKPFLFRMFPSGKTIISNWYWPQEQSKRWLQIKRANLILVLRLILRKKLNDS